MKLSKSIHIWNSLIVNLVFGCGDVGRLQQPNRYDNQRGDTDRGSAHTRSEYHCCAGCTLSSHRLLTSVAIQRPDRDVQSVDPLEPRCFLRRGFCQEVQRCCCQFDAPNPGLQNPVCLNEYDSAQVAYEVTFHTSLLEDLTRQMEMPLTLEDGGWKVQWSDSLILPELTNGSRLALDYPAVPPRQYLRPKRLSHGGANRCSCSGCGTGRN